MYCSKRAGSKVWKWKCIDQKTNAATMSVLEGEVSPLTTGKLDQEEAVVSID